MADTGVLPTTPLLIVVAAALVDGQDRVLVQRRPLGKAMAGLWEFPGGKVEPGETPEAALVRELDEELGIVVDPAACAPLSFTGAPGRARHLLLLLYLVRGWEGEPRPIEATALRRAAPAELRDLPMPHGDRRLIAVLERALAG